MFVCFHLVSPRVCSAMGCAGTDVGAMQGAVLAEAFGVLVISSAFRNCSPLLCVSGAWYMRTSLVSCVAGRLIQFTGGTVMPSVNAFGKEQQVICNPEKVIALFARCTPGGRATGRESSPWASPVFPGSARSLALAHLRACMQHEEARNLQTEINNFKWVVFLYCKHFHQFWKTTK